MKFLLEFKQFYKEGDIVLIEYWWRDIITPVKVLEKSKNKLKVSHNVSGSKIQNAPDEVIKISDVIDFYKSSN